MITKVTIFFPDNEWREYQVGKKDVSMIYKNNDQEIIVEKKDQSMMIFNNVVSLMYADGQ